MNQFARYSAIIILACSGFYFFKGEFSQESDPKADDMRVDRSGVVKSGGSRGEDSPEERQVGQLVEPDLRDIHKDLHEEIANGSQRKLRDKDGHVFIYDASGKLIREDLPNGEIILHTYTKSGERISETINQF